MCSSAFWTVLPCGSSTAFFGVMMIFAFISGRRGALGSDGGEKADERRGFFHRAHAGKTVAGKDSRKKARRDCARPRSPGTGKPDRFGDDRSVGAKFGEADTLNRFAILGSAALHDS